jgi:homocitrate synthase NifV
MNHPDTRTQTLHLSDTTLRDGEQSYGIILNDDERLQIATALDAAGIPELEAGFPALPAERTAYLDRLVAQRAAGNLNARLIGWHRPMLDEIAHSARRGLDGCAISVPSSRALIGVVLGKDEPWVLDHMQRAVSSAKAQGLYVVADYQDAFAADEAFLITLSRAMADAGADRIRLCDTVGRSTPEQVTTRMRAVMAAVPTDLEIHAHNDLGLAVANALAVAQLTREDTTGRNFYIACTVNGMGERAGNTALEVIAVAVQHTMGLRLMDLTHLAPICALVAGMTGRPIPVNAPAVGMNNWHHASGLHVDGLIKSLQSYELIDPAEVGFSDDIRKLVCGQYGGRAALRTWLARLGVTLGDANEVQLLEQVALKTVEKKAYLTDAELTALMDSVL